MTDKIPFINIHTHHLSAADNEIAVYNVFAQCDFDFQLKPGVYCSVGLHPWHIHEVDRAKTIENLSKLLSLKPVIALGETGLDRKIDLSLDQQIELFQQQIELAELYKKPVIIHCVKAYNEILQIRSNSDISLPWIIHGFNASVQIANQLAEKNIHISIGESIIHNVDKFKKILKTVPLEMIFFENDDSDTPIETIYKKTSEIKKIELRELKRIIFTNFSTCFKI